MEREGKERKRGRERRGAGGEEGNWIEREKMRKSIKR